MSKRTYEELRDMLCHELDVLTKKGEITKDNLDHFHKLTSTLYKVEELIKNEGYSNDSYSMMRGMSNDQGYSRNPYDTGASNRTSYDNGSYAIRGSYDGRAGRDGDGDGRYSEEYSGYSRGRSSYRDYSRDGYSRHSAKELMIDKLETMADITTNDKDRKTIMTCIEELSR